MDETINSSLPLTRVGSQERLPLGTLTTPSISLSEIGEGNGGSQREGFLRHKIPTTSPPNPAQQSARRDTTQRPSDQQGVQRAARAGGQRKRDPGTVMSRPPEQPLPGNPARGNAAQQSARRDLIRRPIEQRGVQRGADPLAGSLRDVPSETGLLKGEAAFAGPKGLRPLLRRTRLRQTRSGSGPISTLRPALEFPGANPASGPSGGARGASSPSE